MKMGVSVLVFLAALATTLLRYCSLALTPDGDALLEVKTSLNDTNNLLSNWNDSDESPCKWTGITCSPQDQRVVSIDLPHKQLEGTLSPNISKLDRLQRLDLSRNNLRGVIPSSLVRLWHLTHLNLSANSLSGEIPKIGALSKFGFMSYNGNSELCGLQVNNPCGNSLGFPAEDPIMSSSDFINSTMPSSDFIKGLVTEVLPMLGFFVMFLLGLLGIWKLTKMVKSYKEAKKQVHQEPG
ncbi:hypothetical protein CASFOL_015588 [Castilleja foliolosa]|uniref:Leucine-rich repeat-containing N-terminal plant-type domain-containing protein n=1 Tax=Castilleja foliolosa TaxID=1961234 RepID=A0ABD3DE37_9LAMI